jgi:DNA-binding MarR family transcriptional regulator
MKKSPSKWIDIYPQGTKEGDEEQGVFICLARNAKWTFRSVAQIAKESNLTKERVEEILQKYWKKGMVFQNPNNEDQWAYWERVPDMVPEKKLSITEEERRNRMDKVKKP